MTDFPLLRLLVVELAVLWPRGMGNKSETISSCALSVFLLDKSDVGSSVAEEWVAAVETNYMLLDLL